MKSYFESVEKILKINWVSKTSNGRTMVLSRFIKNQEAKGLLSNLGVIKPLSKVPILDDILF